MHQIDVKYVSRDPANPRAELAGPTPDILFQAAGQGFEIINGRMRADVLADLGRLVPALNVDTEECVLIMRTPSGQWLVATQQDADDTHREQAMRLGRKQNAVRALPAKPVPFYRQFDKRKF